MCNVREKQKLCIKGAGPRALSPFSESLGYMEALTEGLTFGMCYYPA